jgi:hypothetical protein
MIWKNRRFRSISAVRILNLNTKVKQIRKNNKNYAKWFFCTRMPSNEKRNKVSNFDNCSTMSNPMLQPCWTLSDQKTKYIPFTVVSSCSCWPQLILDSSPSSVKMSQSTKCQITMNHTSHHLENNTPYRKYTLCSTFPNNGPLLNTDFKALFCNIWIGLKLALGAEPQTIIKYWMLLWINEW